MTFSRRIATKTAPISFYRAFFITCQRKYCLMRGASKNIFFTRKILISGMYLRSASFKLWLTRGRWKLNSSLFWFQLSNFWLQSFYPCIFAKCGKLAHLSLDRSVVPRARGTINKYKRQTSNGWQWRIVTGRYS